MLKDPYIDLQRVYLFNIPLEIRELKKILSKYTGTKRAIGLDDVLDCIFYVVASNDGQIDLGEIYDYMDGFNGYDASDPDESLAIDPVDIHAIAQIAEDIMQSEGEFLADEVHEVEMCHDMCFYFAEATEVGNVGYVEVKLQYQRDRRERA